MNRRSVAAALGALLLLSSPAGSQVRLEGPGAPGPRPGNRNIHERSELVGFWAGIAAAATIPEAGAHLRRYGPLPIAFTGQLQVGREADGTPVYGPGTVVVHRAYPSRDDEILGTPAIIVDFEITEGGRSGMRSRRVPIAGGAL